MSQLANSATSLQGKGFCTESGQCKLFPVIIGEFGTRLTDPRDLSVRGFSLDCLPLKFGEL